MLCPPAFLFLCPFLDVINPRLSIPVFRNLFFGSKKTFLTGFLRISFFPAFSGGFFHRNVVLERSQEIRFFLILQEFFTGIPVGSNSCIYSGFLRIPEDSCSREVICSRQTLPQLALPPASPLCRSTLQSPLKGSYTACQGKKASVKNVVGVFYSVQYHVSLQLNLNSKNLNTIESPYCSLSL